MSARPLRVATLITRLEGGAGVLALRGATVLDPADVQVTIITGEFDQAALHGLLERIRLLGLDLVEARRVDGPPRRPAE